jgi:hypothetical protein
LGDRRRKPPVFFHGITVVRAYRGSVNSLSSAASSLPLTRMPEGIVQFALNTTQVIVDWNIGVSRSGRPTMTFAIHTGSSPRKCETWNRGT